MLLSRIRLSTVFYYHIFLQELWGSDGKHRCRIEILVKGVTALFITSFSSSNSQKQYVRFMMFR